jgi:NADH dehydrogenase [ubiquinone] 1 alpha subcomplex assembly factor 7
MADETSSLEAEIRRRIAATGSIGVGTYMELCLTHPERGYYTTRDPLGAAGDFTTAPEISQMFGELIGLWAAAVWRAMDSPSALHLVELGPGRGTMIVDALRAARVVPEFRDALAVHLVEISPALGRQQRRALELTDIPVSWHRSLDGVPDGPLIIVANEFFDALPVSQAVMCADGWHERVIRIDEDGALAFGESRDLLPLFDKFVPEALRKAVVGDIFEWRSDQVALEIGRRLVRFGGAALIFDYGHFDSAAGETLQAVGSHAFADPLRTPGEVDLTAHVDFQALAQAVEGMGARVHGPITQAALLRRLGIRQRAAALKAGAPAEYAGTINSALARLTDEGGTGMGALIKAVAFSGRELETLPGFET